jgi:hypothetical protein
LSTWSLPVAVLAAVAEVSAVAVAVLVVIEQHRAYQV